MRMPEGLQLRSRLLSEWSSPAWTGMQLQAQGHVRPTTLSPAGSPTDTVRTEPGRLRVIQPLEASIPMCLMVGLVLPRGLPWHHGMVKPVRGIAGEEEPARSLAGKAGSQGTYYGYRAGPRTQLPQYRLQSDCCTSPAEGSRSGSTIGARKQNNNDLLDKGSRIAPPD